MAYYIQHGVDGFGHQLHGLVTSLCADGEVGLVFHDAAFLEKSFAFEHINAAVAVDAAEYLRAAVRRYAADRRLGELPRPLPVHHVHDMNRIPLRGAADTVYSVDNLFVFESFPQISAPRLFGNLRNLQCHFTGSILPEPTLRDGVVIHVRQGDALRTSRRSALKASVTHARRAIRSLRRKFGDVEFLLHTDGDGRRLGWRLFAGSGARWRVAPKSTSVLSVLSDLIHARVLIGSVSSLSTVAILLGDHECALIPDGSRHSMPTSERILPLARFAAEASRG